ALAFRHALSSYLGASTPCSSILFFNATAPPETYTLSLHDALPISIPRSYAAQTGRPGNVGVIGVALFRERLRPAPPVAIQAPPRSEEHTSELQSRENLVCRLLLEKKKKKNNYNDVQQ